MPDPLLTGRTVIRALRDGPDRRRALADRVDTVVCALVVSLGLSLALWGLL